MGGWYEDRWTFIIVSLSSSWNENVSEKVAEKAETYNLC